MDATKYLALFVTETREHLHQCNAHLLAWERDPSAPEPLQGLFRSVHTLKGMASTLGFARLTDVAHAFEHLLAAVRAGEVAPTPAVVELGFAAVDLLERGAALAAAGEDERLETDPLLTRMIGVVGATGGQRGRETDGQMGGKVEDEPSSGAGVWVQVRLKTGIPMPGARAALVLRRAGTLGTVTTVAPPPDRWMQEGFDGRFRFRLASADPRDTIRAALLEVGEIAEVGVGDETAAPPGPRQVRVEQRRLDTLVALAGELLVARNRLLAVVERRGDPALEAAVNPLARLVGDMQSHVLRARMAPIGEVFERFPRVVRDLARQLDKRVRLEIEGAAIELDRAILDQLADPLLHLVRNALDHGVEGPTERLERGKPVEGLIRLRARRERNVVVVELEDDGRGVDREAIRARARGEGLALPPEGEDAEDLLSILARPGFSTARLVTAVSGRGVGIDAVVHWARSMGGAVALASRAGEGTTVSLRLPLTVAIVPALLVGVADQRFAVPLGFVAETTRLTGGGTAGGTTGRGDEVPIVELPASGPAAPVGPRPGVILEVGGRRAALAVDTLLGQEDIVLGPLVAPQGTPRWINGATILADGRPALVLDPTALVQGSP